jgi:phage terminase small subunit
MARKVSQLGLLTEIDRAALALYCRSWEIWNDAIEQVRESGTWLIAGWLSDDFAVSCGRAECLQSTQ